MRQGHHKKSECYLSRHSGASKKILAFEVALKAKKQIAEDTTAFFFEKPDKFQCRAGQHVRMTLIDPSETDSKGNSRFFSLANSPQEPDLLIAMRMRDTAFKRVLAQLRIGEKVRLQTRLDSPQGSLALHADASKPAVFLIGGIGIVPAFSMIKDAIERKLPHPIFLFYSNRRLKDAPFLAELEKLAQQHPAFKLIVTLTESEKPADSWPGETGFINYSLLKKYVTDPQSSIYYIAGLPEMTSAMRTLLTESGIHDDHIRAEEFTGFNLNAMQHANNPQQKKSRVLPTVIALVIIGAVLLHAGAAVSVYHASLSVFSLKNSLAYLLTGGLMALATFKFKHLLGFVYKNKNGHSGKCCERIRHGSKH